MLYTFTDLKYAPDRDALILELGTGKDVLHVGAADAPYSLDKLEQGLLLHPKLEQVCKRLIGIDMDSEAVALLHEKGVGSLEVESIESLTTLPFSPELIVFGETIEHLSDAGSCIDALTRLMTAETRLLISTPNLVSFYNFFQALRQRETLHPDHRIGFTYGLLRQLIEAHGLAMEAFYFTFLPRSERGFKKWIWELVARRRKGFSETLVAVCRRKTVSE